MEGLFLASVGSELWLPTFFCLWEYHCYLETSFCSFTTPSPPVSAYKFPDPMGTPVMAFKLDQKKKKKTQKNFTSLEKVVTGCWDQEASQLSQGHILTYQIRFLGVLLLMFLC